MIENHFLKNNLCLSVFLSVLICVLMPYGARAAILYLEPSSGQYQPGDVFMVNVRIDTEEECINAVEANLSYNKDVLEGVDFSKGNSILTIWLKEPTFSVVKLCEANNSCGLVSFIGGIPGGYCGKLPGEPGKPDLLGRIIFKAHELTQIGTQIKTKIEFLESSQVLLNDGLGTPAKLTTKEAVFTILPEKIEHPKDEWQEEIKKDIIPPESFEIELHQDPNIFEGKYFIVFSTVDKQTGVDYYEILETRDKRQETWKRAESPYLLEDQNLKSIIKVKAVDKAGNERMAEYLPPKKITWEYWLPWVIIILLLFGAIFRLWKKYTKKH